MGRTGRAPCATCSPSTASASSSTADGRTSAIPRNFNPSPSTHLLALVTRQLSLYSIQLPVWKWLLRRTHILGHFFDELPLAVSLGSLAGAALRWVDGWPNAMRNIDLFSNQGSGVLADDGCLCVTRSRWRVARGFSSPRVFCAATDAISILFQ